METEIPEWFGRGEWVGQTTVHPVGLAAILILAVMMLVLRRGWALLPVILCVCFIPVTQRVVVLGLDFDFVRIIVLAGWVRVLGREEYIGFVWKPADTAILLWAVAGTIVYTLLYGTFSAFIGKLGQSYTALGAYFLFRTLVKEWGDVDRVVTTFAVVSIPVAFCFIIESQSGRNAFAVFGGVPEVTVIREGRFRCQGAFPHPILAGCFWACAIPPLVCSLVSASQRKSLLAMGIVCAGIIVITSSSSTPVSAVFIGFAGISMFVLREHMRALRWGMLLCVIVLHMLMKKPVWHLVARVDLVGGSTGWHRYVLIDGAIKHFDEWWLIGTRSTYHWDEHGMFDITNQYIFEGLNGGLVTVLLFLLLIARTFGGAGRLWRLTRGDLPRAFFAFGLGVAVFVHCTNFIGVTYFGPSVVQWYLSVALIVSLDPIRSSVSPVRQSPSALETHDPGTSGMSFLPVTLPSPGQVPPRPPLLTFGSPGSIPT